MLSAQSFCFPNGFSTANQRRRSGGSLVAHPMKTIADERTPANLARQSLLVLLDRCCQMLKINAFSFPKKKRGAKITFRWEFCAFLFLGLYTSYILFMTKFRFMSGWFVINCVLTKLLLLFIFLK